MLYLEQNMILHVIHMRLFVVTRWTKNTITKITKIRSVRLSNRTMGRCYILNESTTNREVIITK